MLSSTAVIVTPYCFSINCCLLVVVICFIRFTYHYQYVEHATPCSSRHGAPSCHFSESIRCTRTAYISRSLMPFVASPPPYAIYSMVCYVRLPLAIFSFIVGFQPYRTCQYVITILSRHGGYTAAAVSALRYHATANLRLMPLMYCQPTTPMAFVVSGRCCLIASLFITFIVIGCLAPLVAAIYLSLLLSLLLITYFHLLCIGTIAHCYATPYCRLHWLPHVLLYQYIFTTYWLYYHYIEYTISLLLINACILLPACCYTHGTSYCFIIIITLR